MRIFPVTLVTVTMLSLAACDTPTQQTTAAAPTSDACGASKYQHLVGGPSRATLQLEGIPGDSRHYGKEEPVATNVPTRLNFVHSTTAVDSVLDPNAKVIRVFCG